MAKVVVIGGGVSGLTTSFELLERGHAVEVWTRDDVMETVSAVAAAIWFPYLARPRQRVLNWSAVTFARLRELSEVRGSGVHMQRLVHVFAGSPDLWWLEAAGGVFEQIAPGTVPGPHGAAIGVTVPLCDTSVYLPWLLAAVRERGGLIIRRSVRRPEEVFSGSSHVVNCSGLGARELCRDGELVPVRGQVLKLARVELPFAFADDSDPAQPIYVLPRERDVILGGTATMGDERRAPDPGESDRIRAACESRLPQLRGVPVLGAAVGLRPYRQEVRVEVEDTKDGRLVHNYGHGGSGFTLAWGCAREVADLLESDGA